MKDELPDGFELEFKPAYLECGEPSSSVLVSFAWHAMRIDKLDADVAVADSLEERAEERLRALLKAMRDKADELERWLDT